MSNNNSSQARPKRDFGILSTIDSIFAKIKMPIILIVLSVLTVLILFCSMYFSFMSFSIYNVGLRLAIVGLFVLWSVPLFLKVRANKQTTNKNLTAFNRVHWGWKIPAGVAVVLLVITICLGLFTTPMFLSKNYYNLITVNENVDFNADVENYKDMLIPVVDETLAKKVGEKRLGEDNLGSQFTINDYTMSYYNGDIYWIGAIEYTGFFKWSSNSKNGSPGFVMVSATDSSKVSIVKKNIKYVPSAYFGQDLQRKLYFGNMGRFRSDTVSFELDDNGTPHYIQACYKNKFAITSGADAIGVIVLNAETGKDVYYPVGQEPSWVDRVIPAELINTQLDYWGKYNHGFWNTMFAKKELNKTTDGYNYVYNNGSFYLTTGITSLASDESIVGMILANLKTKETSFYKVIGATENAARKSAQGQIQNYSYVASQPVLLNFEGEPTYFITLKDKEGLVKQYAYVNVKDYTKVGISTNGTLQEADADYRKKLNIANAGGEAFVLQIKEIHAIVDGGTTNYYVEFVGAGYEEITYIANIALTNRLPFFKANDYVKVTFKNKEITSISKTVAPQL